MQFIGVIPSRYASTRFPGKPLAMINGKPMLQWVVERATQSRLLKKIIVATDDDRIAKLAYDCGAEVAMTSPDLPTGTDRIWQAAKNIETDVVLNIQGDEPLINGKILDQLAEPFLHDPELNMATLASPLTEDALNAKTVAKIVVNSRDEALYFSRLPIPYSRFQGGDSTGRLDAALKHIGIYAYRKTFLERFCAQEPVAIEKAESLEQLRALWLGARIKAVRVDHVCWGVDTPEDVQKIEKIMRGEG